MKSLALAAAGFTTAFALAGAAPAIAQERDQAQAAQTSKYSCPSWRCGLNGISLNGIDLNGINFNGITLNGMAFNGVNFNGLTLNGLGFNGFGFNGVSQTGAAANPTPAVKAVRLPAGKR